ncbi:DarT1-associated NADAR antitoxin family protein [Vibrio vulnificus]|uniref:DarT1-associated NADAR antitoxin family protein n=1 Tax=Vibrio vulnificus TaxID=672 RepID=UPI0032424E51
MAVRTVFVPDKKNVGVIKIDVHFQWYSGLSVEQKQKNVIALHRGAQQHGLKSTLEVSTKSLDPIGVALSAFNLMITTKKNNSFSVESAFQGSKVFEKGGPYLDLFQVDSRTAKKDPRIRSSGAVESFRFFSYEFPNTPRTYFYDWLYINTLLKNSSLRDKVLGYDSFSDIEFNSEKSVNCQAHAIALYLSLLNFGFKGDELRHPVDFLNKCRDYYSASEGKEQSQMSIF